MDCSPPGSSVHGILQARTLEWVPCLCPGDLPDSGIEPQSFMAPALAARFLTTSATWEAQGEIHSWKKKSPINTMKGGSFEWMLLLRFANFSILLLIDTELSKVTMAASLVQSALHPQPSALNAGAAFLPCPAAWSKCAQLQGSSGSAFSGRTKGSTERGGNCRERAESNTQDFTVVPKTRMPFLHFAYSPSLSPPPLSTTYMGWPKRACAQLWLFTHELKNPLRALSFPTGS